MRHGRHGNTIRNAADGNYPADGSCTTQNAAHGSCTADSNCPADSSIFTRKKPCIVQETGTWAVVYKPPHLPSAPLRKDEQNTLVHWFLGRQDRQAAQVCGKKAIEAGLLHRLDTETRGLVLFAKTQAAYDFLQEAQNKEAVTKEYYAFITPETAEAVNAVAAALPYTLTGQYRNHGKGAKMTKPVFFPSRHYKQGGRLYTTVITSLNGSSPAPAVRCSLTRGYRHQVRTHLASLKLPIAGDPLYGNPAAAADGIPLQLYAIGLHFPLPESGCYTQIALPPPDTMNR